MKPYFVTVFCFVCFLTYGCKDTPNDDNSTSESTTTTPVVTTTTSVAHGEQEEVPISWQFSNDMAIAMSPGFSVVAPDIVKIDSSNYRIYFSINEEGIGSAVSTDARSWTVEDGVRLASRGVDGEEDYKVSHPWVIKYDDETFRMYYVSTLSADGAETGVSLIKSAISSDGLTFTRESGSRIGINDDMGLSGAAHGRIFCKDNGTYVMLFSANKVGSDGPSSIMLATSNDGLSFTLENDELFKNCHDPCIIELTDGRWAAVFRHLLKSSLISYSSDGISWTKPEPLSFYDSSGTLLTGDTEGVEDPCLLRMPDGTIGMYANAVPLLFDDQGGIIGLDPM